MKIFTLKNKSTGYEEFVYIPRAEYVGEKNPSSVMGTVLVVTSHTGKNKEIHSTDFLTNVYIKGDFCSHFYFQGQSFTGIEDGKRDDEIDSEYRICGFDSYLRFVRGTVFALKMATDILGDKINKEELDKFNSFNSKLNLLDGYYIIETDCSEDSLQYSAENYKDL